VQKSPKAPAPVFFARAALFRKWLESNHETRTELLVGFHKRDSGRESMTWPESVAEALCVGWIDGVRRRLDDDSYTIRFTPRRSERELKRHKAAWKFFERCPPWYKRTATWRVISAKRPETRAKRLAELITCCAEGRAIPSLTLSRDPLRARAPGRDG
jgi:uncharacterized protein YdeI (YjbR/CyaY-like superfamily)